MRSPSTGFSQNINVSQNKFSGAVPGALPHAVSGSVAMAPFSFKTFASLKIHVHIFVKNVICSNLSFREILPCLSLYL